MGGKRDPREPVQLEYLDVDDENYGLGANVHTLIISIFHMLFISSGRNKNFYSLKPGPFLTLPLAIPKDQF